jgi:hypothetical protein
MWCVIGPPFSGHPKKRKITYVKPSISFENQRYRASGLNLVVAAITLLEYGLSRTGRRGVRNIPFLEVCPLTATPTPAHVLIMRPPSSTD